LAAGTAGGVMGLKTAAGMEQAKIGFTTMLGSAEKADKFIKQLAAFAAKTPFEFPELQTAASNLVAVGLKTKDVIPVMTTLGNVTSGMGTGSEGIQRAVVALQQMQGAGRISAEDLNQLRDAGLNTSFVFEAISKQTGQSVTELNKLRDSGKLGRKELDALMKSLTTGEGFEKFNGLMEKQSQSLTGLFSTFKDTLGQGLAKAIQPLLPTIKSLIGFGTNLVGVVLKPLPGIFKQVATGVHAFVGAFQEGDITSDGWVGSLERLGVAARGFIAQAKQVAGVVGPVLISVFRGVADAVRGVLPGILGIGKAFLGFLKTVLPIIGQVVGAIISKFNEMRPQILSVMTSVREIISGVTTIIRVIWDRWGSHILSVVKSVFGGLINIVSGVLKALAGVIKLAVALIQGDWSGAWAAVKQIFAGVWQGLKGVFQVATAGLFESMRIWWEKVKSLWTTTTGAVRGIWDRLWSGVRGAVSTAVSIVATILKRAFNLWTLPIRVVMTAIGTIMLLGWLAIRKPVLAAMTFIRDRVIIPVWNAITSRFRAAMSLIRAAWTRFWGLVRSGASVVWNFVYRGIILPVWNRIKAVWTAASSAVRGTWTRFWSAIKGATTPAMNAVRDRIRTVLDHIKNAFSTAKANIKRIWDGLRDIVSKPVRWVVDHVYNKPLVPVWNRVAGLVSGPKLSAYARGGVHEPYGVRPGYTPGRDTHPIMVSGGEAILRPEFTRAVGRDWVERANRAARKGRARKFVQDGGIPGFAGGGVVGWLKGVASNVSTKVGNLKNKLKDWVLGSLRSVAGKILDPVKGVIDRAMPNSGVGRTVGGIGKKAIDLVLDKIKKEDAQAVVAQGGYSGPPGTGSRRRVRWHGGTFTERFRNTLEQAQKIAGTYINVLQGGFSRSVRASGTSHYGDAIDTSWKSAVLSGLRRAGVAAWHRTPAQGFPHHIHGVPLPGRGYPAGSGKWQAQDYLRGGNGLALGGIVRGGRGGIFTQIGEGRRDELVLPLPPSWRTDARGSSPAVASSSGVTVMGDIHGYSAEEVADAILKKARRERALRPVFAA